jgi:hypothetical protein
MTDVHPSPDEIKPYVAIGPTPALSVTVHKTTFDRGFIFVTLLFLMFMLIVFALIIYLSFRKSSLPPPPPPLISLQPPVTLNGDFGAAFVPDAPANYKLQFSEDASELTSKVSCETNNRGKWVDNKCKCTGALYGPTCSQERHDKKYFAVGNPNQNNLQLDVIQRVTSDKKSFNDNGKENSCSSYCDNNDDCIGFIYHNPNDCTLLRNEVVVLNGDIVPYEYDTDATLYLKFSSDLQFDGRIFLATRSLAYPTRFWLTKETPYFKQLRPNMVERLDFFPGDAMVYGDYVGIYRLHPFLMSDVPAILKQGDAPQSYFHRQGTTINLPTDWRYKTPLYVAYLPKATITLPA